jgi:hypothetical protein
VPTLIGAVTVIGQRTGPRVAGVLTALPVVAGPIALFVAIEQGAAFEARSAVATLAALLAVAAFCILYARTCLRRGWPASLLAGLCGFGLTTLALERLEPGVVAAAVLALASPFCVQALTPRPPPPARVRPVSRAGLLARMGAGAALMIGVTALAEALGPTWSGLLTVFPVATTVLTVSWHRTQGPEFAVYLLRGLGNGLYGLAVFFAALGLGLERLGIAPAFTLALAGLASIQLALLRRGRA